MAEDVEPIDRRIPQRLYSPVEMAYVLNMETTTVTKKCRNGKIKATKINNQWRITGDEIRRYVAEGDLKDDQQGS